MGIKRPNDCDHYDLVGLLANSDYISQDLKQVPQGCTF